MVQYIVNYLETDTVLFQSEVRVFNIYISYYAIQGALFRRKSYINFKLVNGILLYNGFVIDLG